jgi:TfoX/Sxy family transcriptional regulator of competence genes
MASDKSQLDFVLDQLRRAGAMTAKPMFGEYGIYCDGKIVALFCDNQLFVKPTKAGKAFIQTPVEAPPYPGAKPYFLIEEQIEDERWASELIRITAQELPAPKKKSKTSGRSASVRPTKGKS